VTTTAAVRCSAGNDSALCCTPGVWGRLQAMGEAGLRALGEPLPDAVMDVAASRGLDPHELDHHVEGEHGWEPHDTGYATAVSAAAFCLASGGCP
jgi:hypothetical protein